MIGRVSRVGLVLLAPLMLLGCLLAPGKFTSSLVINADRSFTYTYSGEVYAFDMNDAMKGMGTPGGDEDDKTKTSLDKVGFQKKDAAPKEPDADTKADNDTKNRALAAALAKEIGYRKVEYLGDNKFMIDYQISGKLDHTFIFPYNLDAGVILPFVAVELRANGTVRIKAPGFANDSKDTSGVGGDAGKAAAKLDGTFTLDTDAELISQNNEEGATTSGARKIVTWKASPLTSTAPMAVLKFK
ncbi:MAG: hypothetical protein V4459_10900 [Pseudomonadota bacterium]